jgi:hypothetical protein
MPEPTVTVRMEENGMLPGVAARDAPMVPQALILVVNCDSTARHLP